MTKGVRFNTVDVLPSITALTSVISTKNSLPALANIKFELDGSDYIMATTSNIETWVSIKLKIIGDGIKTNPFCVNGVDFLKSLKNLGNVDVTMTIDEEKNTITCNYGVGHFTLPYESADDFPLPQMETSNTVELTLQEEQLSKAIERTSFAIANDQLRPIMNGVHFDIFNDGMVAVASDGQKLVKYFDDSIMSQENGNYSFTLSAKPCAIIRDVFSISDNNTTIRFAFNESSATINSESYCITTRLVEGKYPNYNSVIPKEYKSLANVNKDTLCHALRRVMPLGNAVSELVSLKFTNGSLEVSAEDIEFSKAAKEIVSCTYQGEELSIGLKGSAILLALSNIVDDDVTIEMTEPSRTAVLYGNDKNKYLSLLMPMLLH